MAMASAVGQLFHHPFDDMFGIDTDNNRNIGCGQIQAELNHDSLEKHQDKEKHEALPKDDKHAYDSFQNMCGANGGFYKTRNPFESWSDEKFLAYIFNTPGKPTNSKTEIRNMTNMDGKFIQYKSQDFTTMDPNKPATVTRRTGVLYNIPDVDNGNPNNVLHVLTTINSHADIGEAMNNIYLFVDTGHCLLDLLRDKSLENYNQHKSAGYNPEHPGLSPPPTLHVILSQASFADASQSGKDLYKQTKYFHILQAWWYKINIEVPHYEHPNNHMFHSQLSCLMTDEGPEYPESKIIHQFWYLYDPFNYPPGDVGIKKQDKKDLIWETYDANGSNSISQCQNDLIFSNDPKNYPVRMDFPYIGIYKDSRFNKPLSSFTKQKSFDVGSPYYKSLCYQRKRSGDGFQIWFVNKFADIIQQDREIDFDCTQAGPRGGGYGNSKKNYGGRQPLCFSAAQDKNTTLKKSFFVTIDWMAFSWAAFCNINVIFYLGCNHATGARAQVMIFIAQENASFY